MKLLSDLQSSLTAALNQLGIELEAQPNWEHPAEKEHGDYATNVALMAYGQLDGKQKQDFSSPRELAEKIVEELEIDEKLIKSVTVAGPGFINFTLSEHFLLREVQRILTKSDQLIEPSYSGKKVVVEFTDPNPFKQLHIGHLYSNTVGESICRLFEAAGAEVRRANYYGDVGMHVAKSIWGMIDKLSHEAEVEVAAAIESLAEKPLAERVKFLGESYAAGATAFKESETAQAQIGQLNKLIYVVAQDIMVAEYDWQPQADYGQFLDAETKENWDYELIKLLYQRGKEWSLAYFDSVYQRVGMSFDNFYPESVTGEYGLKFVQEGLEKGVFIESRGAIVYEGDPEKGLHTRVFVNSVGLPTYETKELGLAPAKDQDGEYDLSLIITGNEIDEYFQVLLAAMTQLNPELGEKTQHLGHGMVRLPDGKMSSRTGDVITAQWLLDEAANQIEQVLETTKKGISDDLRAETAEQVGQAAIKYAFLKSSIGKDIAFDFEESLSFQGNSGPYLQYSYVRCQSVIQKVSDSDALLNIKDNFDSELSTHELDLLRNLYQYSEVVSQAVDELAPHVVCTYLYQLSQSFNQFYTHCPILQAESEKLKELRLGLTAATAEVLGQGLDLLNIPRVERM